MSASRKARHPVPEPLTVPYQTADVGLEGLGLTSVLLQEPTRSPRGPPAGIGRRFRKEPGIRSAPLEHPRAHACTPLAPLVHDDELGAARAGHRRGVDRQDQAFRAEGCSFHRGRAAALRRPIGGQDLLVGHDQLRARPSPSRSPSATARTGPSSG